ncbi:hypothetical protein [Aestuariivirga litoralis]|uniref:hypothetical protein n=1 Tax=Aestuariivirga litoralis TaxID=2650924 RepID=UPI0018C63BF2|nr:hypothetical protein [Aestuariivirga litoralis]MBG1233726.1 hypothetical protein [Aestuariivirga litoralis]
MFSVTKAKDFYAMVVGDFDDLMEEPDSPRRAMHCAIMAYHLHDWVWAEIESDEALLTRLGLVEGSDRVAFVHWIKARCPYFFGVQALAHETKHSKPRERMQTERVSGWGSGPYGVGPYGRPYLLIDWGEEAGELRWQPALTLLEIVVRFWRDFFREYLPADDLPASRHHVA